MKYTNFLCAACGALASGLYANSTPSCQVDAPVELSASGAIISSGTVTKLDLSWFGLDGSTASPAFFTLAIKNSGATDQKVRVLVEMESQPTDAAIRDMCSSPCWLQREMTEPLTIPAHGTVIKTSSDLLTTQFTGGGIEAVSSPFKSLVGRIGFIPSTYLKLNFSLLCENPGRDAYNLRTTTTTDLLRYQIGSSQEIKSTTPLGPDAESTPFYQTVRTPDLLTPGVPPSEGSVEIMTATPTFIFQSDLANPTIVYPANEPKFTLEIWKISRNETPLDAVNRRPLAKYTDNIGIIAFPSSWASLEPGQKYVWRVSAHLRGPVQEPLYSELREFEVSSKLATSISSSSYQSSSQTNLLNPEQIDRRIDGILASGRTGRVMSPEERRLFQALFSILGDDPRLVSLMTNNIADLDHLRLDGHPITLESVETLAAQIRDGRRRLVHLEIP